MQWNVNFLSLLYDVDLKVIFICVDRFKIYQGASHVNTPAKIKNTHVDDILWDLTYAVKGYLSHFKRVGVHSATCCAADIKIPAWTVFGNECWVADKEKKRKTKHQCNSWLLTLTIWVKKKKNGNDCLHLQKVAAIWLNLYYHEQVLSGKKEKGKHSFQICRLPCCWSLLFWFQKSPKSPSQ